MKRIIALLLVVVMCLPLVACGNNVEKDNTENPVGTNNAETIDKKSEAEKAIVGTWKREDSSQYRQHIITFNKDNTGTFYNASLEKEGEITWKYDEELSCYIFVSPSEVANIGVLFMKNDGQTNYLEMAGEKYYRQGSNN